MKDFGFQSVNTVFARPFFNDFVQLSAQSFGRVFVKYDIADLSRQTVEFRVLRSDFYKRAFPYEFITVPSADKQIVRAVVHRDGRFFILFWLPEILACVFHSGVANKFIKKIHHRIVIGSVNATDRDGFTVFQFEFNLTIHNKFLY